MVPHLHYVEPYAGGLSVLLARDPQDRRFWMADTADKRGVSEVVNDLDGALMNFWRVLRGDEFERFAMILEATPFSRQMWEKARAHEYGKDAVADAAAFFVHCRQSLAGRRRSWTSLTRNRTRREMNGSVSEWLSAVDGLSEVHARLRSVVMECRPALEVIQREDGPNTLTYCDPPYLLETRANGAKEYGEYEMTAQDHAELLDTLQQCKGKVMLSGYPSELYNRILVGWNRHTFDLPNNAAGGKSKGRETECLWVNH